MDTRTGMTILQAADYLNVSQSYLIRLIDTGNLAFHIVGTRRNIALEDLKAYKEQQQDCSYRAMERLQEEAQEIGMGY